MKLFLMIDLCFKRRSPAVCKEAFKSFGAPSRCLLSLLLFTISTSEWVATAQADDTAQTAKLTLMKPESPADNVLQDATRERLRQYGIEVSAEEGQAELRIARLDSFVMNWTAKDASTQAHAGDAESLLDGQRALAGLVRDHQAFVMRPVQTRQALRPRLVKAPGLAGPLSVGGLSSEGGVDHLVAMMLLEASGSDPLSHRYTQYRSYSDLVQALLSDQVQLLSIPVSHALKLPFQDSIDLVATSAEETQDITISVPTLSEQSIDMTYINFTGLYLVTNETTEGDTIDPTVLSQLPEHLFKPPELTLSEAHRTQLIKSGLIDDYIDKGSFKANVIRQLSTLYRFHQMLR